MIDGNASECCCTAGAMKRSTGRCGSRGASRRRSAPSCTSCTRSTSRCRRAGRPRWPPNKLPELHQAIEDEARERLARGHPVRGPGAARRRARDPAPGRPTSETSSATPTNTPIDLAIVRAGSATAMRPDAPGAARAAAAARCSCCAVITELTLLLSAYASGWFPMAVDAGEIRWYSPDPRGIIPLDTFHVPRRLARVSGRAASRSASTPASAA